MPTTFQGAVFFLATNAYSVQEMARRTPSEALVLTYLRLRQVEKRGGATREQIVNDTGVSHRSLDRALTKLSKEEAVRKRTIWEAANYTPGEGESDA